MMTEKVRRQRGREGDSTGEVGGDKIIRPWALFATVVMPYLSTYIHEPPCHVDRGIQLRKLWTTIF